MRIVFINKQYWIVDNGGIVLSAPTTEELYTKALAIMHAFSDPVDEGVSSADTQRAMDILTSKG
jgi:hypothetical protein